MIILQKSNRLLLLKIYRLKNNTFTLVAFYMLNSFEIQYTFIPPSPLFFFHLSRFNTLL